MRSSIFNWGPPKIGHAFQSPLTLDIGLPRFCQVPAGNDFRRRRHHRPIASPMRWRVASIRCASLSCSSTSDHACAFVKPSAMITTYNAPCGAVTLLNMHALDQARPAIVGNTDQARHDAATMPPIMRLLLLHRGRVASVMQSRVELASPTPPLFDFARAHAQHVRFSTFQTSLVSLMSSLVAHPLPPQ